MKNKKGFTLIELLGIIVILALIMLLIIPIVDNSIQVRKDDVYKTQIDNIALALKNWGAENMFSLPNEEGGSITVTLGQLKQSGFIGEDVNNPLTGECFPNDMLLTITRVGNGYKYDVLTESGSASCDETINKDAPIIALKGKTVVYVEVNTPYVEPGLIVTKADGTPISQDNVVKTISGPRSTIDTSVLGTYQILYTVEDSGVMSQIVRTVIVRDTIAPEITVERITTISDIGGTFDIMAGVSATDNSGVNPAVTSNGTVNTNLPGTYTITYTATDASGNTAIEKRTVIINDSGKPTTQISFIGKPLNEEGWTNGAVNVKVESTDANGIDRTYTCVSNSGRCTPTTSKRDSIVEVTYDQSGDNGYICAYAVDTAGNKGDTVCTPRIRVDNTPPTCTTGSVTGTQGQDGWYRTEVSVTGTCNDTGSGCVENTVTNTYGSNTSGATLSPGVVTDKAGNSATCPNSATFKIDRTNPTCTTTVNGTANSKGWYSGSSLSATGTCSDSLSGCRGNSSASVGTGRNTLKPGAVTDKAGNSAECDGVYVQVDNDGPTAPDVTTDGKTAYVSGGEDELSGICWYKVDGTQQESGTFTDLGFGSHTAYAVDCAGNVSPGKTFDIEAKLRVTSTTGHIGMWACNGPGTTCTKYVWREKLKTTIKSADVTSSSMTQITARIKGTIYTSTAWMYNGSSMWRKLCLGNNHTKDTGSYLCKSTSAEIKAAWGNPWYTDSTYSFDATVTLDNPNGCYDVVIYGPYNNGHITTTVQNIICVE